MPRWDALRTRWAHRFGTPPVPTELRATVITADSITVAWRHPGGAAYHEVTLMIADHPDMTATSLTSHFTITRLSPDTVYRFTVRAVGPTGRRSDPAGPLIVTTGGHPAARRPGPHPE